MIVLFQPVLLLFHFVNVKSIKGQFPFCLVKSFYIHFLRPSQGLNEVLSGSPGHVDSLGGQVTFKGPGKPSSKKIIHQDNQEVALGKQNVRAACPKDTQFFSSALSVAQRGIIGLTFSKL